MSRIPYTNCNAVAINGHFAYIAAGTYGLSIVNVDTPSLAREVGHLTLPWNAVDIAVSGNYAYVADGSGLCIISITNPLNPQLVAIDSGYSVKVSIIGNIAYVALGAIYHGSLGGFRIVDISNRASPHVAGSWIYFDGGAAYLAVQGNTVCVTGTAVIGSPGAGYHILYIIDILDCSNPANPRITWRYQQESFPKYGTAVNGNYSYVGDTGYLRILDVSNPDSTRQIGTCTLAGTAIKIKWINDRLFIADGNAGLRIIDVTNPTNSHSIGYYTTPGNAVGVDVSGNVAYVADGTNFGIYDCSQALGVIDRIESPIPEQFSLKQNYPNPFNPATTIEYTIPKTSKVELKLLDITGREVGTLVNFHQNPGTYRVKMDAGKLSSGIYFYRLNAGGFTQTRKLSVIR